MKSLAIILATALLVSSASEALACSIVQRTKLEQALDNMFKNKRAKQSADCSFTNGGEGDELSGEPAVDLGDGRIGQKFGHDSMLVVVCGEKQAAVLLGVVEGVSEGDSCGPTEDIELNAYLPPNGKFDFRAGADFAGFLQYARSFGMTYTENLDRIFRMDRAKDRVDLLCGCKVFYPELLK